MATHVCLLCGSTWESVRVENPKACQICKRYDWNKEGIKKRPKKIVTKCKVDTCTLNTLRDGYCNRHLMQIRDHGKILSRTIYDPNDFIIDGDICKIGHYNLKCEFVGYTEIDTKNVEKCKPLKWRLDNGYAHNDKVGYIQNFIMGTKEKIDHIDRNRGNNKENNLRLCTHKENNYNKSMRSNNTSGYIGVYWHKKCLRWIAQITKSGIVTSLSSFKTPEEAALAYNEAVIKEHGDFAVLNIIKPKLKRRVTL
jgi:hypothetical protein